jgi:sec-independent protein translocase protein TatA
MGFGGISPGSLIVVLVIVMVVFGTKRLRNMGKDLGAGVKGFREGMKDGQNSEEPEALKAIQEEKP